MCGIFGYLGPEPLDLATISAVHDLQRHRGPDDQSSWSGQVGAAHLALAFERLAIIDLSANANQPFHSASGSVLVYNGEIYNYVELRRELEAAGIAFRTSSDTEVLLAALDQYGIEKALARLNGMFAFIWLCGKTRRLWIARDRVGEKPLYFRQFDRRSVAFASELKTLVKATPRGPLKLDYKVVHNFLASGVVDDTEDTFFGGVRTLRPGHYAEVIVLPSEVAIDERSYWPPPACLVERRQGLGEAVEEIRSLLSDAVRIRLRSDVPLGFLVSGGLDSSIITALSLKHGIDRERLTAFSIVNLNVPSDESHWIDLVTHHLGISVNKVTFDPRGKDLLRLIDDHVHFHDEPMNNLSIVAHAELMRAARERGVTVLLSGQGGDELFCGYRKYVFFAIQQLLRERRLGKAAAMAWPFLRNDTLLGQFSAADAARYTKLRLPGVSGIPLGEHLLGLRSTSIGLEAGDVRHRQLADLLRFSTPAITHAEDRASMAFSREVRFPFFDYRLMEAALALPLDYKIGDGWTKHILRLAAEPFLPKEITWRKGKTGHFSATADWLVKSIGREASERLDEKSPVFTLGLLAPAALLPRWRAFWRGEHSQFTVRQIISILTLDRWLRNFSWSQA
jgi:asparagine synthase (glutamine-hydrolysing)